ILSAQYDGLLLEVQLTYGELRRLPLARPNYGRRTEYTAKITVETAPYIEDRRARGRFPGFPGRSRPPERWRGRRKPGPGPWRASFRGRGRGGRPAPRQVPGPPPERCSSDPDIPHHPPGRGTGERPAGWPRRSPEQQ